MGATFRRVYTKRCVLEQLNTVEYTFVSVASTWEKYKKTICVAPLGIQPGPMNSSGVTSDVAQAVTSDVWHEPLSFLTLINVQKQKRKSWRSTNRKLFLFFFLYLGCSRITRTQCTFFCNWTNSSLCDKRPFCPSSWRERHREWFDRPVFLLLSHDTMFHYIGMLS